MYVHDFSGRYRQTNHLGESRPQPIIDQDSGMLWVVLKLHDVVISVCAAHEMALRAAAHSANVLNCLYGHRGFPLQLAVKE
jgi:hypothetical protein